MTEDRPFRRGDKVTIHHLMGVKKRGRVICNNRLNKYGLSVVVLVQTERGTEIIESFGKDGKRWRDSDCCISHGWDEDADT